MPEPEPPPEPPEELTIKIPFPANPVFFVDQLRSNARFETALAARMGDDNPGQAAQLELAEAYLEVADAVDVFVAAHFKYIRAAAEWAEREMREAQGE
jgi:hypothetical protein